MEPAHETPIAVSDAVTKAVATISDTLSNNHRADMQSTVDRYEEQIRMLKQKMAEADEKHVVTVEAMTRIMDLNNAQLRRLAPFLPDVVHEWLPIEKLRFKLSREAMRVLEVWGEYMTAEREHKEAEREHRKAERELRATAPRGPVQANRNKRAR